MKLDIDGIHNLGNKDLPRYITKKIGGLDKYIPRHARRSAHAEVKVKEDKIKDKKECTCEVIMHLPHETITAKETTMNMFAAVDIVEEKVKTQLRKYKAKHGRMHTTRIKKFLHRFGSSEE
jgi:putative sigma-54 modulation protein